MWHKYIHNEMAKGQMKHDEVNQYTGKTNKIREHFVKRKLDGQIKKGFV